MNIEKEKNTEVQETKEKLEKEIDSLEENISNLEILNEAVGSVGEEGITKALSQGFGEENSPEK